MDCADLKRATLCAEMLGQRPDIGTGIRDPAMIKAPHNRLERVAIDWIKSRIFSALQHLVTHANSIAFAPAIAVCVECGPGRIAKAIIIIGNVAFRRGAGCKGAMLCRRIKQKRAHGLRVMIDMRVCGKSHVARQKWHKLRQVAPTQKQRCVFVQQHPRCLAHQTRNGHRYDRTRRQHPCIAVAGTRGRAPPIHDRDLVACALQPDRTGYANDTGTGH